MDKLSTKQILAELNSEVEMMDRGMFNPPGAVEQGETVELTIEDDDLRKLYCTMMHYCREMERAKADLRFEPDRQDLKETYQRYDSKSDALVNLFWYALRTRHELWGDHLGIRKDWKVVSISESNHPKNKLKRLLRELGGDANGGFLEL